MRIWFRKNFTRTLQEAKKQKHIIELSKQTSLVRYVVEFHTSKNSPIRKKIDKTVLEKYGVSNLFKSEEIKDKIKQTNIKIYGTEFPSQNQIVKKKVKSTCLERYGVEHSSQHKPFVHKSMQTRFNNPNKGFVQSSIMADNLFLNIYENVLTEEDKEFVYFSALNKEFGKYGNEKYNFYDFVLLNKKKVIEFYGDYWHCNPVLEKYQNGFVHPHLGLTSKEIWNRDLNKNELIRNLGFEILVIWKSDILDNYEIVLNRIINFLN